VKKCLVVVYIHGQAISLRSFFWHNETFDQENLRLVNQSILALCGDSPSGDGYHAWLLVETSEDEYMPVEATQFDLIKWSNSYFDNYFEYDEIFETIQDALDWNHNEFDWWN